MAIYYFNVSVISRSAGRSATASAAYRAAEKIKDEQTGEIHDYRKKKGVDEKFILAPDSAPSWVHDREKLWNEVEQVERRKNSQLAREIQVAIPVELNRNQQIELVREFARGQFVNQGMVADVSFHDLNSHNPHAHIMLTMREIDEDGFNKKKNRDWNKRELLEFQRSAWSTYANEALEKAGIEEKIDHRTLAEQGINRIPQIHLGSAVTAMMKRGVATYKGDQWLAIESANQQIKSLERSLAAVEKEINSEKKVSAHQASRSHAEYMNTAQLVRQELGNDISDSRLDLEIYLRADSKSEIISESAVYNQLREDNPRLAKHYLKAIAHVALTYKSLSDRKTPDLDRWAKRMVNVYLAKFHVQENNLSQNLQPKITKGKGLTM
ncbi:MAG: MobQ family relaxase [Xenococcaceae cyanobacterium MO_234.B1]|nr:MobQ family relaxase [Xenococcaceae cyanobacterium MO_234.B1]